MHFKRKSMQQKNNTHPTCLSKKLHNVTKANKLSHSTTMMDCKPPKQVASEDLRDNFFEAKTNQSHFGAAFEDKKTVSEGDSLEIEAEAEIELETETEPEAKTETDTEEQKGHNSSKMVAKPMAKNKKKITRTRKGKCTNTNYKHFKLDDEGVGGRKSTNKVAKPLTKTTRKPIRNTAQVTAQGKHANNKYKRSNKSDDEDYKDVDVKSNMGRKRPIDLTSKDDGKETENVKSNMGQKH
jgi:hypothetical protein